MSRITCQLTFQELSTVLAALRYWQERQPKFGPLDSIATNGGQIEQLSPAAIENLCQRLNGSTP